MNVKRDFLSQVVWNKMRRVQKFSMEQMQSACLRIHPDISPKKVEKYCNVLRRQGYLEAKRGVYRLTKITGIYAPALIKGGVYDPNREGLDAENRIWKIARIVGKFTATEMCSLSRASRSRCVNYLRWLCAGGYVTLVNPNHARGKENIYRMVRDTGAIAPFVWCSQKGSFLFDPNNNQFINVDPKKEESSGRDTLAHTA